MIDAHEHEAVVKQLEELKNRYRDREFELKQKLLQLHEDYKRLHNHFLVAYNFLFGEKK